MWEGLIILVNPGRGKLLFPPFKGKHFYGLYLVLIKSSSTVSCWKGSADWDLLTLRGLSESERCDSIRYWVWLKGSTKWISVRWMLNLSSYKNEVREKLSIVHYKYFTMHEIELYQSPFYSFQREIFFFFLSTSLWAKALRSEQIFLTFLAHIYGMFYVVYMCQESLHGITLHLLPSSSVPGRTSLLLALCQY